METTKTTTNVERLTNPKPPKTPNIDDKDHKMEPNSQNQQKKSQKTPLPDNDNKDVDTHVQDDKGKPKTDTARKDADSPTRNKPEDADEESDKIPADEELKMTEQQPHSIRKALPNPNEESKESWMEEMKKTTKEKLPFSEKKIAEEKNIQDEDLEEEEKEEAGTPQEVTESPKPKTAVEDVSQISVD